MQALLLHEKQGGAPPPAPSRPLFRHSEGQQWERRRLLAKSIGITVVDVTPGDSFELIVCQTSGSTKNVAADELTWFAIEVVG